MGITAARVKLCVLISVAVSLVYSPVMLNAQAAAGDLDSTFGSGGKVTTDFYRTSEEAHALLIANDRKIIAVGVAFNGSATSSNFSDYALARDRKSVV